MLEAFLPSVPMLIIIVAGLAGGLWIFKRTYTKQLGELQQSVINTYKSQNDAQELQIKALEKKVARLEGALSTIQITLKKRRGLLIEVDDDTITLIDQRTGAEHSVKINLSDQHEAITIDEKKEKI